MRKRNISILAIVIAGVITAYFSVLLWGITGESNFNGSVTTDVYPTYDDTAFGGLFAKPDFNDSLPHYLYQHLADSFKQVNDDRLQENKSLGLTGRAFGSIGVYSMKTPQKRYSEKEQNMADMQKTVNLLDSLTIVAYAKIKTLRDKDSIQRIKDQLRDTLAYFNRTRNRTTIVSATDDLYYFSLQGYVLPEKTAFFVQNGTYNLAFLKVDSVKKSRDDTWRYGHYEQKAIPVRYSPDEKRVLIPISQGQFNLLNTLMNVLFFILLFTLAYFFLGLPVQILINISKGKAFDDRNIRRFAIIAWAMFVLEVFELLSPYMFRLLFYKTIPDDFTMLGFWSNFWDHCWLFFAAIALFITGKAFQKGNKLQKEQDLTI
jgi:hypothetical protein